MNFIERFAPLSNLQATVLEIDSNTFAILPEGAVSWTVQEDATVVWYKDCGQLRFVQVPQNTYLSYAQAFAAWAGDSNPERYPSTREVWGWLNATWGELRP